MPLNRKESWDFASLILETPPSYDIIKSIHAWVYSDVQPVPEITKNRSLRRIFTLNDDPVPVTISQSAPGLSLNVAYPEHIDGDLVRQKIIFTLGLDIDIRNAIEKIRNDRHISYLTREVASLRPYTADTPFEGLTKCVLQQQISFRAANVITRRLVLEACSPIVGGNLAYYGFPGPDDILVLGSEGLKSLGVGYKTDYLLGLASKVDSGDLNLGELKKLPHTEVEKHLRPIRGIGEWTINAFSISSLRDFSVFPLSDLGVRNLLGNIYGDGSSMKTEEVRKLTERWGSSSALVLYLLMCADVLGLVESGGRSKKP